MEKFVNPVQISVDQVTCLKAYQQEPVGQNLGLGQAQHRRY